MDYLLECLKVKDNGVTYYDDSNKYYNCKWLSTSYNLDEVTIVKLSKRYLARYNQPDHQLIYFISKDGLLTTGKHPELINNKVDCLTLLSSSHSSKIVI